ncbi:hypothetical protein GRJ2_002448000 [Grus japonensis]|uniref:Uncharacterized protein n=1 Tax=Grus japonensis TaxID=30415 RepID=A0ABC9XQ98_GRUJA
MPAGGTGGGIARHRHPRERPGSYPELVRDPGERKPNIGIAPQVCDGGHKRGSLTPNSPSDWVLACPGQVEDGVSRFFGWMLTGTVAQRAESASAPPMCSVSSGMAPQDDVSLTAHPLGRSLSHSFLGHRTTTQLLRRSTSQLALQAKPDGVPDTETNTEPDTDAHVLLWSED